MRRALSITVIALVLAAGCKKNDQQAAAPASSPVVTSEASPEQLGEIGATIKKEPAKADEILAAHGMDQKSFETAIRKVTESPAASKRYAAAFKKASA